MNRFYLFLLSFVSASMLSLSVVADEVAPPVADLLDVVFSENGTATDVSAMHNTVLYKNLSDPATFDSSTVYKRYQVNFNPPTNGTHYTTSTGTYYRVDYATNAAFQDGLADGHSFECLVKFGVDYASTPQAYETKFFSSQEAGGTGFVITNTTLAAEAANGNHSVNGITFLPNVTENNASNWVWANSGVKPNGSSYYHLVGVYDKTAEKARIYVDGVLKSEVNAPGEYFPPRKKETNTNSFRWVCIGGDAGNNLCQNPFKGSLAIARIYDDALTADQVTALWNQVKVSSSSLNTLKSSTLSIYPNPASEVANIDLTQVSGNVAVQIYTIQGLKVYEQTLAGGAVHALPLSGLTPSVYTVKVDGQSYKLIVKS